MNYVIKPLVVTKIKKFYQNVAKKYKHSYSTELMNKNIDDAINGIYLLENKLQRRNPTIPRWQNYFMANTDKWYYAYIINDDVITVVDICHAQNMKDVKPIIKVNESQLRNIIRESIKQILKYL